VKKRKRKTTDIFERRYIRLGLGLFILIATVLLLLNMKKVLHPAEIVLYWMINATINSEFLLITTTNLKLISFLPDSYTAMAVLINYLFLFPMITLYSLTLFIEMDSIKKRIILFFATVFLHSLFFYLCKWIALLDYDHKTYYWITVYWGAVLIGNLFILVGYRRLLKRAGIIYGLPSTAKKL
jgi:hypothetical protein